MARVALLLGGNQGDVKRTLQTAQQLVNYWNMMSIIIA